MRDGQGLPRFVEQEFRDFLTCGCLAAGFARFRCPDCHLDRLLPFSCKGRGFCPSPGPPPRGLGAVGWELRRATHDGSGLLAGIFASLKYFPDSPWVLITLTCAWTGLLLVRLGLVNALRLSTVLMLTRGAAHLADCP